MQYRRANSLLFNKSPSLFCLEGTQNQQNGKSSYVTWKEFPTVNENQDIKKFTCKVPVVITGKCDLYY